MFGWFKQKTGAAPVAQTAMAQSQPDCAAQHAAEPNAEPVSAAVTVIETAPNSEPSIAEAASQTQTATLTTGSEPAATAVAAAPLVVETATALSADEKQTDAGSESTRTGNFHLPINRTRLPKGYREPAPLEGMVAIEMSGARMRPARVASIKAKGRKLIASVGSEARTYTYTRLADGSYRLGDRPSPNAPRLVLGLGG